MKIAEQVRSVHSTAHLYLPSHARALALVAALSPTDEEARWKALAIEELNDCGIATLDVDLSNLASGDTEECGRRILDLTLWAAESLEFIGLPIVYFGIGSEAYAAARVAATRPDLVTAVVGQANHFPQASKVIATLGDRFLLVPGAEMHVKFATRWLERQVGGRSLLPKDPTGQHAHDYLTPMADLLQLFPMDRMARA